MLKAAVLLACLSAALAYTPDNGLPGCKTECGLETQPTLGELQLRLKDEDFVFDLAGSKPAVNASGGLQFVASRENFPALSLSNARNGGGGTQVLFKFEPCGFRTPHFHPRGTENFFVISGKVRASFIREAGSQQLVSNDIHTGFAGFFPEAHIHFLQNIGCEEAMTLSTFDNSDEGLVDTAANLRFLRDTIQITLGSNGLVADDDLIRDVLVQSQECLRRCK